MSIISLNTLNALISLNFSSIHLGAQASSQAPLFSFLPFPLTSSAFANLLDLSLQYTLVLTTSPVCTAFSLVQTTSFWLDYCNSLQTDFLFPLYALQTTARLRFFCFV